MSPSPQSSMAQPPRGLTPAQVQQILADYAKAYKRITVQTIGIDLVVRGLFFLVAALLGARSLPKSYVSSSAQEERDKDVLRRKVAALGVDVKEWERPLKQQYNVTFLLILAVLGIGFLIFARH